MSTAGRHPRSRTWLRVLVLLLAVLLPAAPAEAAPPPVVAAETCEYDALDTALRAPADGARRTVAPPRPAPRPAGESGTTPPVPPRPAHPLDAPRTMVLRC
jgi:hypothetical protein